MVRANTVWYDYNHIVIIIIIIVNSEMYICWAGIFTSICSWGRNRASSASKWGCGTWKEAETSIARAGGVYVLELAVETATC